MRLRWTILAILVVAAGLRVFHLGTESVWLDEAASIQIASDPPADILSDSAQDVHPPLYYLVLHVWMRAFGDTAQAVRLLSVVFSLLAIVAVARAAAFWFGRDAGVMAAVLFAISPLAITFAQEGRMYALLSLAAILSVDEFLRVVRTGARGAMVRCVAVTAAMLYTHAYAGFVVAGEALWLAGVVAFSRDERPQAWRRGGLAIALSIVAFLPWVPSFLAQVRGVERSFWIPASGTLVGAIEAQAGSLPLACVLVALAAVAVVLARRSPAPALFATVVVCVVGIPYGLSRVSSPIFLPKYTIGALPAFLVLAAAGLMRVPFRAARMAIVATVIALTAAPLAAYASTRHKDDWRSIVAEVDRHAEPGDLVVLSQTFATVPFDYYSPRTDLVELPFLDDADAGLTPRSLAALARVATAAYGRVWLVRSDPDAATAAMTAALTGYDVVRRISGGGVDAALYVRRDTPPGSPIR